MTGGNAEPSHPSSAEVSRKPKAVCVHKMTKDHSGL